MYDTPGVDFCSGTARLSAHDHMAMFNSDLTKIFGTGVDMGLTQAAANRFTHQ